MRILRAADHRVMPWKNGGGTTTEIAVFPEGASLDDFDWRVSMARVETDGPFSSFPGIDRTLSVLDGEGIILNVAGRIPFGLTNESEPLSFPADLPTQGNLIGGPITDLNVMTRRGRTSHAVQRLAMREPLELASAGETILVLCHRGDVAVQGPQSDRLGPLDVVEIGPDDGIVRLKATHMAMVFVVRIYPMERNR